MLTTQELQKQIFQINNFYAKKKIMGPIFPAIMTNEENKFYYFEENGILQAFVIYNFMKRIKRINIKKLAVKEEVLRQGFGTELINYLKSFEVDIQVHLANNNAEVHEWYKNKNFSFIECKKNTSLFVYTYQEE